MLNIKECDRIEVDSIEKMERVIKWYDDNKEWVENHEFRCPIPSGVIDFKEELITLAYEPESYYIRMYLYMDGVYVCSFRYLPCEKRMYDEHLISFPPSLSEERREAAEMLLRADNTLWKCSKKFRVLMYFIALYRDVVEVSEKKRNSLTKHQAKRLSRLTKHEVSLFATTYKLMDVEKAMLGESQERIKRKYTKPTSEVSVRGFYRTTKTGKRVWVRPFIRYRDSGGGEPKTYKV